MVFLTAPSVFHSSFRILQTIGILVIPIRVMYGGGIEQMSHCCPEVGDG